MTQEYNGHKDKGHWNIALWINNSEGLYHWAVELVKEHGRRKAARIMANDLAGTRTPDGFKYTLPRIYEALEDIV